jgi:hypothetical protein
MDAAKIQLSAEEFTLVQNAQWLLTKNNIIEKVVLLLGDLVPAMKNLLGQVTAPLPDAVTISSPKISKGEKYEGLPWVMLDFPRVFGKEDVWAIRTFFWWGHYFSITLHLKGTYKERYQAVLLQNRTLLKQHDFYICIAGEEWQHHFMEDNYIPLHQLDDQSIEKILSGNNFCKISAKIPLKQWDQAHGMLVHLYQVILQSVGH